MRKAPPGTAHPLQEYYTREPVQVLAGFMRRNYPITDWKPKYAATKFRVFPPLAS